MMRDRSGRWMMRKRSAGWRARDRSIRWMSRVVSPRAIVRARHGRGLAAFARCAGVILALGMVSLPTCRSKPRELMIAPVMLVLTSPAFAEGDRMPEAYTCAGSGVSPPLSWNGIPMGAQSLALIMQKRNDPTIGDGGGRYNDVLWLVYNIPPDRASLPETYRLHARDDGSVRGVNVFGVPGYDGPCPARGDSSRYVFELYAINSVLSLDPDATASDLYAAIEGKVLARGILSVTYWYGT